MLYQLGTMSIIQTTVNGALKMYGTNHATKTVRHTIQNIRHKIEILWGPNYFTSISLTKTLLQNNV